MKHPIYYFKITPLDIKSVALLIISYKYTTHQWHFLFIILIRTVKACIILYDIKTEVNSMSAKGNVTNAETVVC